MVKETQRKDGIDPAWVIPSHIAIIMDGNGRWAKKRLMPRSYGHKQGSKNVESICEAAYHMGVKYLTIYAFSTENWKRPKEEVDTLMSILSDYMKSSIKKATKNNMCVKVIGDTSVFDETLQADIRKLEEVTKEFTGLHFQIALNYGGRDEICRAAKKLCMECKAGTLSLDEITEERFASCLDTADIPDPEMIIRTSGEMRLSNYLLWQSSYAEFYTTDVLWPDFSKADLIDAIDKFNHRERKFGGVQCS